MQKKKVPSTCEDFWSPNVSSSPEFVHVFAFFQHFFFPLLCAWHSPIRTPPKASSLWPCLSPAASSLSVVHALPLIQRCQLCWGGWLLGEVALLREQALMCSPFLILLSFPCAGHTPNRGA